MIKKFDTFNEAKLVQGDLLEDVKNAFAFLVDENPNIKISDQRTSKSEQVSVLIPFTISPSRKYTIEEYANLQDKWNEIVQDAWVATQQLTDKGTISVETYIEGFIRLTFFTATNTDVFKVNPKTVYVSKVNLLRACKFPSCDFKITNSSNPDAMSGFLFEFEQQQKEVQFYLQLNLRKYSDFRSKVEIQIPHIHENGSLAYWGDQVLKSFDFKNI